MLFYFLVLLFLLISRINCWQLWDYDTVWAEGASESTQKAREDNWYSIWGPEQGTFGKGPRPRMGHTMVKATLQSLVEGQKPDIYVWFYDITTWCLRCNPMISYTGRNVWWSGQ
jgi:hypothetical protein